MGVKGKKSSISGTVSPDSLLSVPPGGKLQAGTVSGLVKVNSPPTVSDLKGSTMQGQPECASGRMTMELGGSLEESLRLDYQAYKAGQMFAASFNALVESGGAWSRLVGLEKRDAALCLVLNAAASGGGGEGPRPSFSYGVNSFFANAFFHKLARVTAEVRGGQAEAKKSWSEVCCSGSDGEEGEDGEEGVLLKKE